MPVVKYDRKDIIPIVVGVLGKCNSQFLNSCFRIAIQLKLADMKELVNHEVVDEETIALLQTLDDELTVKVIQMAYQITEVMYSLCNIYGLDLTAIMDDDAICVVATDFFNLLAIQNDHEEADLKKLDGLYYYSFSVVYLLYHLTQLIIHEQVNLKYQRRHYCNCYALFDGAFEKLAEQHNRMEITLLCELGELMINLYDDLGDMQRKGGVAKR